MEDNKYILTLDQIIDGVLNSGALGGEDPEFVRACEKNVNRELLNYTHRITGAGQDNPVNEDEAANLIEEKAGSVMDALCEVSRVYLKIGMKLGAGLIFQLLKK